MSEEEEVKDTLVEEILQQGDTAIIYPEAPEDEQSPAETGNTDENGNKARRVTHLLMLDFLCETAKENYNLLVFLINQSYFLLTERQFKGKSYVCSLGGRDG